MVAGETSKVKMVDGVWARPPTFFFQAQAAGDAFGIAASPREMAKSGNFVFDGSDRHRGLFPLPLLLCRHHQLIPVHPRGEDWQDSIGKLLR